MAVMPGVAGVFIRAAGMAGVGFVCAQIIADAVAVPVTVAVICRAGAGRFIDPVVSAAFPAVKIRGGKCRCGEKKRRRAGQSRRVRKNIFSWQSLRIQIKIYLYLQYSTYKKEYN